MITNLAYWKISDDDGVSVAFDLGVVKDEEIDDFRFGWGMSAEAVSGLYRDVTLKVGGSIFNNTSARKAAHSTPTPGTWR